LREKILQAIPRDGNPACVRLTLSKDGVVFLESGPLPATHVRRLRLSSVRVDSTDPFLRHKTTNRAVYEAARQECDAQTDALLSNERSEITETTIMNVALFREGRWVTPATSCGLLPGVMREELLARGEIVEGVILVNSIRDGEPIRCFNALRGTYEVALGPQTN
jgi:branched-subunit amino acid aminotransferase/4-amino-4-deoxychorismate lyase